MKNKTPEVEPYVSDHAIVRYLERVYKLDRQKVTDEILTPSRRHAIIAGAVSIKAGPMTLKVKDRVVVTVLVD